MKEITYQNETRERLDKFLVKELADLSRSQIQKLIKSDLVLVNGHKTPVHHFLKKGDKILIHEKTATENPKKEPGPESTVIAETGDYLVINKPAGLIVHPAAGIKEKTLVDWLLKKYPKIKTVGDNPDRPGLVHRLDKDVSGLLIIAKNQAMFEHLKKQFQNHLVKKEYLALANGSMKADEGMIDLPIKRSRRSGKMAAQPKGAAGKNAVTEFSVIKKFKNYTYLKVNLKTGRTHQIRTHFKAYGHPLVGDRLYQNKKIKDKFNLNRIFLHAAGLSFDDLANNRQEYQSRLPKELKNILIDLK